ncbi:MAG: glycosyltransferase, partial [Ilumatobacteraceae bacterium]|nr:glycosyltransferase [Ilumatobacteraceae bacterium]
MHTVVVVPTYDEIDNIETLCRGVRAAAPDATILVVDDGSPDGTAAHARRLAAELGPIEVIERASKSGLGDAYRAGFEWAIARGADVVVQIDADLSHDPAVIP